MRFHDHSSKQTWCLLLCLAAKSLNLGIIHSGNSLNDRSAGTITATLKLLIKTFQVRTSKTQRHPELITINILAQTSSRSFNSKIPQQLINGSCRDIRASQMMHANHLAAVTGKHLVNLSPGAQINFSASSISRKVVVSFLFNLKTLQTFPREHCIVLRGLKFTEDYICSSTAEQCRGMWCSPCHGPVRWPPTHSDQSLCYAVSPIKRLIHSQNHGPPMSLGHVSLKVRVGGSDDQLGTGIMTPWMFSRCPHSMFMSYLLDP